MLRAYGSSRSPAGANGPSYVRGGVTAPELLVTADMLGSERGAESPRRPSEKIEGRFGTDSPPSACSDNEVGCVDSKSEAEEGLDVAALDVVLLLFDLSADAGGGALPKLEIFWAARNGPGSTFAN